MARVKWTGGTDTNDFKKLAVGLRRAAPEMYVKLMRNLREGAERVADDARMNASFSSKIPATIKVRETALQVTVTAGAADVPQARLFESGNAGARGAAKAQDGEFSHPVFGHRDNWVNQPMRPFLRPAIEKNAVEIDALVVEAIGETTKLAHVGLVKAV